MGTPELVSLFSKVGATSESDKALVVQLHNTVFNGIPHGENSSTSSSVISPPPLVAFRAQFRKHVRVNPFKYLSASKLASASRDAETEFNKVMQNRVPEALGAMIYIQDLRQRMMEERVWLEKINGWKRADFLESNLEEAVSQFKDRLWRDYFGNNVIIMSSENPGIRDFGARLSQELVGELAGVIPSFEESSEVAKWVSLLETQCSGIVSQGEASEQNMSDGLSQYRTKMTEFLANHRFVHLEKVEVAHAQAISGVEADPAFVQNILNDPVIKPVWNNKILEEWDQLEKDWRDQGAVRIDAVREGMKSQCENMLKEMMSRPGAANNFPLDSIRFELESLFSPKFDNVMRRILKKVEKFNSTWEQGTTTPTGSSDDDDIDSDTTTEEVEPTPTPSRRLDPEATVGRARDITPGSSASSSSVPKKKKTKKKMGKMTARKCYGSLHTRRRHAQAEPLRPGQGLTFSGWSSWSYLFR